MWSSRSLPPRLPTGQDWQATPANLPTADDGIVKLGNAIFNFNLTEASLNAANGSVTAVRIDGTNEATVPRVGVFQNATVKSVASQNGLELDSLGDYISYVNKNGGPHSFGALPPNSTYFNRNEHVKNVIASGNYAGGVTVHGVGDAVFSDLNFGTPDTYGFSIDKDLLPEGEFVMHLSLECGNDIITMRETIDTPDFVMEKKTNGFNTDRPEDAIGIREGDTVT